MVAVGLTFSFVKLGGAPVIPALDVPAATPDETTAFVVAPLTVLLAAFFRLLMFFLTFSTFAAVPEPRFDTAFFVLLATLLTLFVAVLAAFVSAPVIDEKSPPIPEFDAGALVLDAIYLETGFYAANFEVTGSASLALNFQQS